MRAYLLTTGVLFGLVAVAHILRIFGEGAHLATDPWFILLTLAAVGLCVWAMLLLRAAGRARP
jgi:hypothetical protein